MFGWEDTESFSKFLEKEENLSEQTCLHLVF